MKQYLDLLKHIMENGQDEMGDVRTGVHARSVFGYQMRFDLSEGFPLVTTKKMFMKGIIHELLWFLKGDTNIKYLTENGVKIWNQWANEDGDLGPIYGRQWVSWPKHTRTGWFEFINQIENAVTQIQRNPNSRRIMVSSWNVSELEGTEIVSSSNHVPLLRA